MKRNEYPWLYDEPEWRSWLRIYINFMGWLATFALVGGVLFGYIFTT